MIKITGTIKKVLPKETFSGGFDKRIFWIDDDSDKYPNTYSLELWKSDTDMIDNYQVGDLVTCYVDLKGKFWQRDGREGVMNTIKCWNIEKDGKAFKAMVLSSQDK